MAFSLGHCGLWSQGWGWGRPLGLGTGAGGLAGCREQESARASRAAGSKRVHGPRGLQGAGECTGLAGCREQESARADLMDVYAAL